MGQHDLFHAARRLASPWEIESIEFVDEVVHIHISFPSGSRFDDCPVCDNSPRTWRHLDCFQFPCYVHAHVPRIQHGDSSVDTVQVPWLGLSRKFTDLFEYQLIPLSCKMPVASVAQEFSVSAATLWRLVRRYIAESLKVRELSKLRRIGFDETASRRGHNYISVFVDLDTRHVLFACEGRSGDSLKALKEFLETHGVASEHIKEFCFDMSPAFLSGIKSHFESSVITLDKFHLVALVSKAVDETRREGARRRHGSRSAALGNANY